MEDINFNNPTIERPHPIESKGSGKGIQKIWKFNNGYGASVVRFLIKTNLIKPVGSYGAEKGLWELAIIKYTNDTDWSICYDTPIADNVIGYLSEEEVINILQKIKQLK